MPASSALDLLKDRAFLTVWLAVILSFLGHFVHVIASAWVMTDLTHSATMVALVQTAASLPMALLALVSGALADIFDRRHVILASQVFLFAISMILVGLSYLGLHTPLSLLTLVFCISLGSTILVPAWQGALGDLVTRDALPDAISLHTVGANIIKTLGPFVGGVVLAGFGATSTFLMSAFGYVPAVIALSLWRPPAAKPKKQRILSAIKEGLLYFRANPSLFTVTERIFLFGLTSAAVLSLLPLIARNTLQGDADIYGLLFGGYGLGAIVCGVMMSKLRRRFGIERVSRVCFVTNAGALLILSQTQSVSISFTAATLSGGCWLLVLTLLNSTLQLASPRALLGRMVSIYMTFTYLGVAIGGWVWGLLAEHYSLGAALITAAAIMIMILPLAFLRPLPRFQGPKEEIPPPAAGLS